MSENRIRTQNDPGELEKWCKNDSFKEKTTSI